MFKMIIFVHKVQYHHSKEIIKCIIIHDIAQIELAKLGDKCLCFVLF